MNTLFPFPPEILRNRAESSPSASFYQASKGTSLLGILNEILAEKGKKKKKGGRELLISLVYDAFKILGFYLAPDDEEKNKGAYSTARRVLAGQSALLLKVSPSST